MTMRTATSGTYLPRTVARLRHFICGYQFLIRDGHLRSYLGHRLNHISRSLATSSDPRILGTADKDCCKGFPIDGTVENLGRDSDGNYRYRYTEGPKDKAFMEKKDREYLTALKDSDDPAMQARFEEEFATLDLSLEHHRNLKREFEPFTKAYREAAGGGGEGGGGKHPAWEAKIAELKEETEQRITQLSRERAEDRATMAALRAQVNEQAERLSASQARASELEASLERLRAERAEDRRLLERHSGSLARLGEASDSHATTLATLQATLTESVDAQRRALQQGMEDLETRLGRLSSETRDTKRGSLQLKASYEQFRASLALAGHLIVRVDRPALTLGDSLGEGDLTVAHAATWQEIPCVYQHLKLTDISDADALTFRREALSLITMKHPRLTIPYAYTDRPCGVLMPRRVSLQTRITGSPLRWEMRYRIAHDMAQGLAYLHEQGQVHGHLKPANVLLDDDERASLSDFGMSQTRRLIPAQDPTYLAPETQKRHPVNDERSDVYSFGMILWSMATGRAPFSSTPDMPTLRTWIAAGEKETLPAGTPAPYKEIVERCWLSPEARPRAQDLVRTLGHVLRPDRGGTDLSLGRTGGLSGAMHSLRASYLNLPESSHIDAPLGVIHASPVATETSPGSIPPPGTDAGPPPRV